MTVNLDSSSFGTRIGTEYRLSLVDKLVRLNWLVVLLVCLLAAVGCAMLYSAGDGDWDPWARRQVIRFAGGLVLMLVIALIDIRFWMRMAYAIYLLSFVLLIGVEVMGQVGMGAQRWINLGFMQLQPSEIMKVATVLALARYFHGPGLEEIGRPTRLIIPLALVLAPTGLVLQQPDLGTALMLLMVAGAIFFVAGVRLWKFAIVIAGGLAAIPVGWQILHDYQRERILTFLDPSRDPLGAGYHITQSTIALGSGGVFGRGFGQGTQSHLNFLPERQTDFIFTMLAEEFGLMGSLTVMGLYALLIAAGIIIGLRSYNQFGRLLAIGLATNIFLYVFINIAMVTGRIPVVGVPMPLVSYGGTAMLTVMIAVGLILSVSVHRDQRISRHALERDT
ncbi:MAG: rod shape-determining protein RodA [Pseudomonadota bacterium]